MTIGVEGVLTGVLADYGGAHSKMKDTEVVYVEIDTHNLKSIAVDALYADGTEYKAGTDIDRNKMLLVEKSVWDNAQTVSVTCLSNTGYNEATYSGVLSGAAGLRKVGAGTLDLDQTNTYTGGTVVEDGTLRLRGWGTVSSGAVEVQKDSTFMLAYTGNYGEEKIEHENHITLHGTGDAQWKFPDPDSDASLTAALISVSGESVTCTLSGNIDGDGGVLHAGDGKLVLCGDSSYTGDTVITHGEVEVQSATGLGATAKGLSAVKLSQHADLRFSVEVPDTTEGPLVTSLASGRDSIRGDVFIEGTDSIERVLHMAGNGYNAESTTLDDKGTFLLCGAPTDGQGIVSHSVVLTGNGTVVVSDATGSGTTATFDSIVDYTGDFRVEGNKASVQVDSGSFIDGSIHIAGQNASVKIGGNVSIEAGESLHLRSLATTAANGETGTTPVVLISGGGVSVAADGVFSVSNAATEYAYNLSELKASASLAPEVFLSGATSTTSAYTKVGPVIEYTGRFDASIAANKQAVGAVKAAAGLTLHGGAIYDTYKGHTSLNGGALVLDITKTQHLTFTTELEGDLDTYQQVVLFSDVSSVDFGLDGVFASKETPGIYYAQADRYISGSCVNSETVLVYDSEAGVVYLHLNIPEPTTTALSLLALTALCARRRRNK